MLKVIVVEGGCNTLSNLLHEVLALFPELNFKGSASSITEGIDLIIKVDPDVVILDLDLPDGNGLAILRRTLGYNFQTIVVSSSSSHSLRANRFGIADYIQKDVSFMQLSQGVDRALNKLSRGSIHQLFKHHFQASATQKLEWLAVKQQGKTLFKSIEMIESVTAFGRGTVLHFSPMGQEYCSMSFSKMMKRLLPSGFFRISAISMVNLDHVESIVGNSYIKLASGRMVPMEPSRLDSLRNVI